MTGDARCQPEAAHVRDLVARLRWPEGLHGSQDHPVSVRLRVEAADEIEKLRRDLRHWREECGKLHARTAPAQRCDAVNAAPVCCYCDHALSCAQCGREQPAALVPPPSEAVGREEIARIIYDAFPFTPRNTADEKPPWIPGGNSFRQDEARKAADAILALSPDHGTVAVASARGDTP